METVPERIEHTVLGPTTRWTDVRQALDEAADLGMRACVPPCYVAQAEQHSDVPLVTVIDFPHGQGTPEVACEAARQAWEDGAGEVDLVANVGRLKAGEDDAVRTEIAEVVAAVPIPVKVIVEAPLLSDTELDRIGELAAEADAAYCKTATGFSEGGATVGDVEALAQFRPVKASGGIGTWERAAAMFRAGADRIGASSGATIVREWRDAGEPSLASLRAGGESGAADPAADGAEGDR
ncbi:deoxyribose-phosphate aldolase [Halomicrobium urmianum]|uniref:deoxyribose-phosphate aldolase n=1 Tax=Halomicrobium urmianum TaxID=1586233 RepID=UPI001CD94073|nr:deoxyribose-phosphate aldolase [Halomicrobium urmianum]